MQLLHAGEEMLSQSVFFQGSSLVKLQEMEEIAGASEKEGA